MPISARAREGGVTPLVDPDEDAWSAKFPGRQVPVMAREGVEIRTLRGLVQGMLHVSEGARGATVLVNGAGGAIEGPSGVYEELAERLRADGVTVLHPNYRRPNDLAECTRDVLVALDTLGAGGLGTAAGRGWRAKRPVG